MIPRALAILVTTAHVLAGAPQEPHRQSVPGDATTLHRAWLREVMDLDVGGAAADYTRIAADTNNLERWVAAARLAELHSLLPSVVVVPHAQDAPAPLRAALQSPESPPQVTALLERARRAANEGVQTLGADATRTTPLRTAVPAAEEWLMGQIGPSQRDRMRQFLQTLANRSRATDVRRFTERLYAADILRAELEGRPAQANALRTLYFADWRAPTLTGSAEAALATVRANLDAWLAEPELGNQQQTALRELKDWLEKNAATDAAAGVALLLRLPHFAERLLDATGRGADTRR